MLLLLFRKKYLIWLAFIIRNSSLEPWLEGLFAQIHIDLSWWGFGWNRTEDLRITQICGVPRSSLPSYGDGCITEDPSRPSFRQSLVALLQALCARIFFFQVRGFFLTHFPLPPPASCVCARPLSLTEAFLPPLATRLLCLVVATPLVRWLYMCACVCVPLYMHVKNVWVKW